MHIIDNEKENENKNDMSVGMSIIEKLGCTIRVDGEVEDEGQGKMDDNDGADEGKDGHENEGGVRRGIRMGKVKVKLMMRFQVMVMKWSKMKKIRQG